MYVQVIENGKKKKFRVKPKKRKDRKEYNFCYEYHC